MFNLNLLYKKSLLRAGYIVYCTNDDNQFHVCHAQTYMRTRVVRIINYSVSTKSVRR